MDKVRFWIRRYFGFSRRETNGFLFLLVVIIGAIAAPFFFESNPEPFARAGDQARLDSLVAQLEIRAEEAPARSYARRRRPEVKRVPLRLFDPNTLTREEWMAFGLSSFAAGNIVKYRERAGGFRYKEQLSRIYGVTPELYRELAPFIDLPDQSRVSKPDFASRPSRYPRNRPVYPSRERTRLVAFDLNTADTTELKKIRGIGSKLSARIVKFREKLGGFTHEDQLAEVYGLSPEVLDSLRKYVFVQDSFTPQVLSLNAATLTQMQAHPYVGYRNARLILAYRTQHGPFQSLEDLSRIRQLDMTQLAKLKPYLSL